MTTASVTMAAEAPAGGTWADWAGMIASIGCAIHCAAMPMVLAYLPTLGLGWLASEGFHQWMALICFLLASAAFVPGWRKHRSLLPAVWGGMGLLVLTTAAFALEDGCCPSCASASNEDPVAATATTDSECLICETACCELASGEESVCDTACCEGSSSESLSEPERASVSAWSSLTPFITPVGGLLLVIGHVLNHRKLCSCQGDGCCL